MPLPLAVTVGSIHQCGVVPQRLERVDVGSSDTKNVRDVEIHRVLNSKSPAMITRKLYHRTIRALGRQAPTRRWTARLERKFLEELLMLPCHRFGGQVLSHEFRSAPPNFG